MSTNYKLMHNGCGEFFVAPVIDGAVVTNCEYGPFESGEAACAFVRGAEDNDARGLED